MPKGDYVALGVGGKLFQVRRLTKSGSSRYLSIGTVLPQDWEIVKVFVEKLDGGVCVLRLEQIK